MDTHRPLRSRLGRVFRLGERKRAYQLWNKGGMLLDLAEFCRANETTFHDDARHHARLEGRREVWLRIVQHLHLTDEQLMRLYAGQPIALDEN